ncbi:hypothetical protein GCM10009557_47620 [Virgisporangium ochraceum]|uniref:Uncharacterized protein n=1 Tax=Virgisporangium ochraceum TaxID=65505 RepID=A0A8J4EH67_9ACTN|nr:hypothetical protein Voc01_104370 [Virgisporangium ochraceum]
MDGVPNVAVVNPRSHVVIRQKARMAGPTVQVLVTEIDHRWLAFDLRDEEDDAECLDAVSSPFPAAGPARSAATQP